MFFGCPDRGEKNDIQIIISALARLLYHIYAGIDNRNELNYNKDMMDRKTKIWILALTLFCLTAVGAFLLLRHTGGTIAVITVDGVVRERIDLARVKESYDIEIDTVYGCNTVHVEPGAISVTDADCPDKICMAMGRLEQGGIPIICMPHRLVIRIEGDETDG